MNNLIPETPSKESVRLLAVLRHNRRLMGFVRPHGIRLRMFRAMAGLPAALSRGGVWRTYGVPGRWADGPGPGVLLWVHGGGLVAGSPRLEFAAASRYARHAGIPAFVPRYRLAPEHPFPAAADDLLAAYKALLDNGFPAEHIRVAGLSAGGLLMAGLLHGIGTAGLPMPSAVLLLSPMLDVTAEAPRARDAAHPDPSTPPEFIARTNRAYVGDADPADPRLAVLDGEHTGWPPILVQTGGTECIVADAEMLETALHKAGGTVEVQIWPGQIHGFALFGPGRIPEADAAFEYGAEFLATAGARHAR